MEKHLTGLELAIHEQDLIMRQRYVSPRFVDETLWPEFLQVSGELSTYLDEITNRVIGAAFGEDTSDAEEMPAIRG